MLFSSALSNREDFSFEAQQFAVKRQTQNCYLPKTLFNLHVMLTFPDLEKIVFFKMVLNNLPQILAKEQKHKLYFGNGKVYDPELGFLNAMLKKAVSMGHLVAVFEEWKGWVKKRDEARGGGNNIEDCDMPFPRISRSWMRHGGRAYLRMLTGMHIFKVHNGIVHWVPIPMLYHDEKNPGGKICKTVWIYLSVNMSNVCKNNDHVFS
ncbi:hypothetical protein J3R30DRAFT_3682180, partial [Lentinula aciculospora]